MVDGELARISDDVRATTGRELELLAEEGPGAWLEVHVFLDGHAYGSFGQSLPLDVEARIAAVADLLREHTLDEAIWGGWPICPNHNTHPLDAVVDEDGRAAWRCPRGRVVAGIGDLPASTT